MFRALPAEGVNVSKGCRFPPSHKANSSNVNDNYLELHVCTQLNNRENAMLLWEWNSAVVVITGREKLRYWDILASSCRKLN